MDRRELLNYSLLLGLAGATSKSGLLQAQDVLDEWDFSQSSTDKYVRPVAAGAEESTGTRMAVPIFFDYKRGRPAEENRFITANVVDPALDPASYQMTASMLASHLSKDALKGLKGIPGL